jgi:RNA polymerase sigma-70 factor, ECF subfamily
VSGTDAHRRRFDALFCEHLAGIASFCRWRSAGPGDADDAVAEVFLIAWRRLDDVPAGDAGRAWLYATARRVVSNQTRANVRRGRLHEKLGAQPPPPEPHDDPVAARVHTALAAIAPRDREVLLLAEWEGLAPAEIAQVMRCPAATIRVRLHRARRRFRAAFESQAAAGAADHAPVAARLGRCEP